MLINKLQSNSKSFYFFCTLICLLYVFLTMLIAFTTVYSSFDKKTKKFAKDIHLFYDDGGMYVAEFIILSNRSYFEKQVWFTQIRDNITSEEMIEKWNYWGAKVKMLTSPFYRHVGWMMIVSTINKFIDNSKEAFRFSILIFPILILLKYLTLLVIFRKKIFIVLFSMLLLDFAYPYGHAYYWFTISAYAWVFFSTGMIFRFFYNTSNFSNFIVSYCLMITGVLMSLMCLPVILVFITVDILLLIPDKYTNTIVKFISHNFLNILFSLLMLIFVIIWLYLPYNLINNFDNNNLIWHYASKIFRYQNQYFSFIYIFAILIFNYLSSELNNDKIIISIKFSLLLFIFAGFLAVLFSPIAPFLLKNTSLARILPYVYSTAIMGILYSYLRIQNDDDKILQTRKDVKYIICCLLLFGFLFGYGKYNSYSFWKPYKYGAYNEFSEKFIPVLRTDSKGYQYYSANILQQVIVYIIDDYYKKAPIILENIETDFYSVKKVLNKIKDEGKNNYLEEKK